MKGDFSRLGSNRNKHFTEVLSQQGRVLLDWEQNEAVAIAAHLRGTSLKDVIGPSGVPLLAPDSFKIGGFPPNDFTIQPGRMYVDGILVESVGDSQTTFSTQPYCPASGETASPPLAGSRTDLVYLEVWKQHVTALEDPDIREKALAIPDTTTRLKTLWRVHVLPNVGNVQCGDDVAGFPPPAGSAATLTNGVALGGQPADPCVIAPDGGYRLLENRLLRVEIHKDSASAGGPTAKWSTENGATVYGITAVTPIQIPVGGVNKNGLRLTVKTQGRDQYLSLGVNDLVEIVSGEDEIRGNRGVMGTVHDRVSGTVIDVLLLDGEGVPAAYTASPLPQSLYGTGLVDFKVRRWDGLIDPLGPTVALGNTGVSVTCPTVGLCRTGDHWVFAGRTASVASAADSLELLVNAPVSGIHRHYARLALIQWTPGGVTVLDCRPKFPPLTQMIELHYVSGDGQEAFPGDPIKPLIVRVSNGGIPLANIDVTFSIAIGGGSLSPASPVATDGHGLATVTWQLDSTTYRQQAKAALAANPDLEVVFNASLSVADKVAYAPGDPNCYSPPVHTVKDALDELCAHKIDKENGIRIREVVWTGAKRADNNTRVPLSLLLKGLEVVTDGNLDPRSISRATCYMQLELPSDPEMDAWFLPLTLRAKESVNGNRIEWQPVSLPASVAARMQKITGPDRDSGLLARFHLKGNFIYDRDRKLYLDGEDFGVPDGAAPSNLQPQQNGMLSGNQRKGGDFLMWFWVVIDALPNKVGFLVRSGGIASEIFRQNPSLYTGYVHVLDIGTDRPTLANSIGGGYQPDPTPYDLKGAQTEWARLVDSIPTLSKGVVGVMAPDTLSGAAMALCEMWNKISKTLQYRRLSFKDVAGLGDALKKPLGDDNVLVTLTTSAMATEIQAAYPTDFGASVFTGI